MIERARIPEVFQDKELVRRCEFAEVDAAYERVCEVISKEIDRMPTLWMVARLLHLVGKDCRAGVREALKPPAEIERDSPKKSPLPAQQHEQVSEQKNLL